MNQDGGFGSRKNRLQKNVNTLLIFLAIAYVCFLLYQSIFFNFQRNEKIKDLKKEIASLQDKQNKIESLIAYYKTDSFQELEARKKLGLKMPGEKVVKVDVNSPSSNDASSVASGSSSQSDDGVVSKPNYEIWFDFVTGALNKV